MKQYQVIYCNTCILQKFIFFKQEFFYRETVLRTTTVQVFQIQNAWTIRHVSVLRYSTNKIVHAMQVSIKPQNILTKLHCKYNNTNSTSILHLIVISIKAHIRHWFLSTAIWKSLHIYKIIWKLERIYYKQLLQTSTIDTYLCS